MQSKASLSGRKLHYFRVSLMARKLVENPQVSILFCDNTYSIPVWFGRVFEPV